MRVRAESLYRYNPCLLDTIDGRTGLSEGDIVRVKNMRGCPPPNTMNHCHVVNPFDGEFIGLVCCASLEPASQATKRIVRRIKNREGRRA